MHVIVSGSDLNSEIITFLRVCVGSPLVKFVYPGEFVVPDSQGYDRVYIPAIMTGTDCLNIVNEVSKQTNSSSLDHPVLILPPSLDAIGLSMWKSGIYVLAKPEEQILFRHVLDKLTQSGSTIVNYFKSLAGRPPDLNLVLQLIYSDPTLTSAFIDFVSTANKLGFINLADFFRKIPESSTTSLSDPHIRILATERCNRHCNHCGVLASPTDLVPDTENLRRWLDMIPPAGNITFTIGEPFCDPHLQDHMNLILSYPNTRLCVLTTSGISISAREQRMVQEIGADTSLMQRTCITISVNDHSNVANGSNRIAAARQMQMRAFEFTTSSGAIVSFICHIDPDNFVNEFLRPFIGANLASDARNRIIISPSLASIRTGTESQIGSWALNAPTHGFDSPQQLNKHFRCLELLQELTLFPDGSIGPGCCTMVGAFISITNFDRTKSRATMLGEIERFNFALKQLVYSDQIANCLDCVAIAAELRPNGIRDVKKFERAFGPRNIEYVNERKAQLRGPLRRLVGRY
ncbi:hypothetical protein KKF81_05730 [Candidatus Micrarchaeota archaeon]|nr:hypothetical protein [Candidatus Micrarchaeota archaeon]MBU1166429.1 hypothetical protein [Candidatus Micrarchaeota archaeon]MBU1887456.1 hypothetical protein [Candidatus Micrarchaeota archaeon]